MAGTLFDIVIIGGALWFVYWMTQRQTEAQVTLAN